MTPKKTFTILLGLIGLSLAFSTFYTIDEGHHALLLRLGAIVKDSKTNQAAIKAPGLHFKIPVVNSVRIFDTRMQTLDIESSRVVTAEKKDVMVDFYAKWRIDDLALYFTRTSGNPLQAQTLLRQRLNDALRAEFGKRDIHEVVSGERINIMKLLQDQANKNAKELGIKVIDVRIKRIDLPAEVSAAVYDRMRAERERVATEHRATGKAEAEAIRATADAQVTVILATAERDSKKARGTGDAKAAKIYADTYNKDKDFYAFYRSLNAYEHSFSNKNDILVLKPDSDFFKYFNKPNKRG